jgi:hypothetical protein
MLSKYTLYCVLSVYGKCSLRPERRPTHRLSAQVHTHARWREVTCLIDWQTSSIFDYPAAFLSHLDIVHDCFNACFSDLTSDCNERVSNIVINSPHECMAVWLTWEFKWQQPYWQTCISNYIIIKYYNPLQIEGVNFLKMIPRRWQNRGWREQSVIGNPQLEDSRLLATFIKVKATLSIHPSIHPSTHPRLYSPLLDLGSLFSFFIFLHSRLDSLEGDQPVARPLPAHRTA